MAKFSSSLSKVNSETILIIIVIVVTIIVVVYFLNKKQECFADLGNCPFTQIPSYPICNDGDTCKLGGDKYTCYSGDNGHFWSEDQPYFRGALSDVL